MPLSRQIDRISFIIYWYRHLYCASSISPFMLNKLYLIWVFIPCIHSSGIVFIWNNLSHSYTERHHAYTKFSKIRKTASERRWWWRWRSKKVWMNERITRFSTHSSSLISKSSVNFLYVITLFSLSFLCFLIERRRDSGILQCVSLNKLKSFLSLIIFCFLFLHSPYLFYCRCVLYILLLFIFPITHFLRMWCSSTL